MTRTLTARRCQATATINGYGCRTGHEERSTSPSTARYYWYNSNVGNDEGRGLMGAIVVLGDVPEEAKLDRPPQPRP